MEVIDHGVCRLALVSVRNDPKDQSEQVTQLLFGDHYEVILFSDDKKWIRIRIHADLYEGWISEKQHHTITKEFFEFADDILKKHGVQQGIENPTVARMLAYDEDRGLMVKVGTVLTGPMHDAFDRWKYPPEGLIYWVKF